MSLKVAFRTDASLEIGTGHVMRCLTLADALTAKGAQCTFICREHPGNLIEYVRSKGHAVHGLPLIHTSDNDLAHSSWLGAPQAQDLEACVPILAELQPDWLVVDHYALDARWEVEASKFCTKLMVIDDLADRAHICNLLLDQTFGRDIKDYRTLVPEGCKLLCDSGYALLRPEFAALRPYSMKRREDPQLKNLLINMGGVDKGNVTSQVLKALRDCPLPNNCEITVVMGVTAPWLANVQQQAQTMPWLTTVHVGISNMAQLMADSDLAIGAAGATSWERCCLGLPSIVITLAENQTAIAGGLAKAGASVVLELNNSLMPLLATSIAEICSPSTNLIRMSQAASHIVDGKGLDAVMANLGA
ncbi:UDP-2,4-diacetamido-2,4,6-trideoxy-beta-L-altropyranose hydrolase [Limnobacter sp.]